MERRSAPSSQTDASRPGQRSGRRSRGGPGRWAPARLGADELLVGELGKRRPVPQPHRLVEQFRGIGGHLVQARARRLRQPTEPCGVHIARVQLEQVAGGASEDPSRCRRSKPTGLLLATATPGCAPRSSDQQASRGPHSMSSSRSTDTTSPAGTSSTAKSLLTLGHRRRVGPRCRVPPRRALGYGLSRRIVCRGIPVGAGRRRRHRYGDEGCRRSPARYFAASSRGSSRRQSS